MTAPRRLLEGAAVLPPELTRALEGAPGEPTAPELESLAGALGGALGVTLQAAAVTQGLQAGTQAALSGSAKVGVSAAKPLGVFGAWVVGGLVLGAGFSGVAYSLATTDDPAPQASPAARGMVAQSLQPQVPLATPAPTDAAPLVDVSALAPARSAARVNTSASVELPVAEPAANLETELSLLKRAQQASQADPARALALTVEHAKLYPGGALEQEREVLAIDALVRLGRQAEAAARAARFRARYPGSAHARRLETLVDAQNQQRFINGD